MRLRGSFHPLSFIVGVLALGVLVLVTGMRVGGGDAVAASTASVDAVASNVVNITGRKTGGASPRTVYTVPGGQTLVLQGVIVIASDGVDFWVPAFDLKCGTTILASREIMVTTTGYDPSEMGEVGLVCSGGSQVKISGPDDVSASTISWTLIGQLTGP